MSKPKHTPGPWIAIIPRSPHFHNGTDITNYSVFADSEFHDQAKIDNKTIVNSQFTERLGLEESTANAHLIAAAPDLLEALEEVVSWISNWDPSFIQEDEWDETEEKFKAAIRKAKGEA